MPKILIYYEHKAREYQYCHALKYELKRRGYSVGLCQILNRHTWWYKIFAKPKLVVIGTASLAQSILNFNLLEDRCDFRRGRAPFIINLQAEQLCRDDDADYNIITDNEWKQSVYYLCWGKRRKNQILKKGIESDKIEVSGAMHLDFLRQEFKGIYKTKEEVARIYGIDASKKWILFISSFVMATLPDEQLYIITKMIREGNPNYNHDQVVNKKRISVISQEIILNWIDNYLLMEKDCIFIYRPHPKEKTTQDIQRMIESYPGRFFFIEDESVQQWISVSDVVDNWISTAIVEAFAAQKQTHVIQPLPVQKDFEPVILDNCEKVCNYEDFVQSQYGEQDFCEETFPINKEEMQSYYKMDGPCAYIQAADFIEKVYHLPEPSVGKSKFTFQTIFTKWFLFRIYRSIYAVTRIKFSWISPIYRKTMRNLEREVDIGLVSGDILITKEDRKICRKIKRYVKKIAGRDLSETNKILM